MPHHSKNTLRDSYGSLHIGPYFERGGGAGIRFRQGLGVYGIQGVYGIFMLKFWNSVHIICLLTTNFGYKVCYVHFNFGYIGENFG